MVGAANNWAGMAVDEARGIIYVPTGSAAPDFYGGIRKGSNLFANCLLALDANLTIVGEQGQRSVLVKDFFTGFMANVLQPAEIIKDIRVQIPEGTAIFMKYGRRHANTPSIVTVAINIEFDDDSVSKARIVMNAVGPCPFRAEKTEKFLIGKTPSIQLSRKNQIG